LIIAEFVFTRNTSAAFNTGDSIDTPSSAALQTTTASSRTLRILGPKCPRWTIL